MRMRLLLSALFLSGCGGHLLLPFGPTAQEGLALVKGVGLVEIVGEGVRGDGTLGREGHWIYRFRNREVVLGADGLTQCSPKALPREPLLGGWSLDSPRAIAIARRNGLERTSYRLILRGIQARWEVEKVQIDALTGLRR